MKYGVSLAVRDKLLAGGQGEEGDDDKKAQNEQILQRLARRDNSSTYERNKARVCTFWLRDACDRGDMCPYRHENPHKDDKLAKQSMKSRYFGQGDVLADKTLAKIESGQVATKLPDPPIDHTITTLFVDLNPVFNPRFGPKELNNADPLKLKEVVRDDLTVACAPYGLTTIRVMVNNARKNDGDDGNGDGEGERRGNGGDTEDKKVKAHATITFATRQQAENAMSSLFDNLRIRGINCRINWSTPHPKQQQQQGQKDSVPPPPPPSSSSSPPPHYQFSPQLPQFPPPPPGYGFQPPPPPPGRR